ncbi:MAG: hypothetical protein ABH869_06070, partial [Candidatus Omnitrophota bacterium]
IDIVPFGTIADEDFKITWPPEHEIVMSILGFEEVYEFSTIIRMSKSPELDVKFPLIPGIAIMKILSWHEKYPERGKDAEDLLFIMKSYERAGNEERLYGEGLRGSRFYKKKKMQDIKRKKVFYEGNQRGLTPGSYENRSRKSKNEKRVV